MTNYKVNRKSIAFVVMFIIIGMAIATIKAQPKQYALRSDM